MITVLLLVLSTCILHANSASLSESDACVSSIDINSRTVTYSDLRNNALSQDTDHFYDDISTETVIVLFTIIMPSRKNGKESRLYQVSKTNLCYHFSPHLVDLMSFKALNLVERTRQMSLDVSTFTTCTNQSWEKLLQEAFRLEKEGSVRLLHANNQTSYYSHFITSGLLLFMSLGLICIFAVDVFDLVVPTLVAFARSFWSKQEDQSLPSAVIRVLATMNSLNVGFYTLYFAYILFHLCLYYTNLDGISEQFENDHKVSPFTTNAVFLVFTEFMSFLFGLYSRRVCERFSISTACSTALATAVLYHFAFFLVVLIEDFLTAFTSLLTLTTVLVCAYTLVPAVVQYRVVKFGNFYMLIYLSAVVPFLYGVTILGAKDLFNAGYVYIATKFWFAVVLFLTTVTWTFCFIWLALAFNAKKQRKRKQK